MNANSLTSTTTSTARLRAARDADETHPLRTDEEATEVVEYLCRLKQEQPEKEGRLR
jgi:hypothetical protein